MSQHDTLTLEQILLECKRWHQGDKWRDGTPEQRECWSKQMANIDTALAVLSATQPAQAAQGEPVRSNLFSFLDAAAGEGLNLAGIDAGSLFKHLFPNEYATGAKAPLVAQGAGEVVTVTSKLGDLCSFHSTSVRKGDKLYTQPAAGADVLDAIRKAVTAYHLALDTRQHGGVAADKLVNAVQSALNMPWVQGAAIAASGRQS